jgi:NADH dehydrogenase FAD-containing subunit
VKRIELDHRQVDTDTDSGAVACEYLILTACSETHDFGNDELRQNSFEVKGLADAARLRDSIRDAGSL